MHTLQITDALAKIQAGEKFDAVSRTHHLVCAPLMEHCWLAAHPAPTPSFPRAAIAIGSNSSSSSASYVWPCVGCCSNPEPLLERAVHTQRAHQVNMFTFAMVPYPVHIVLVRVDLSLPCNPCPTQVAQAYSEDAARKGGDLGWKRRNDLVGPFAEVAFQLQVSEANISTAVAAAQQHTGGTMETGCAARSGCEVVAFVEAAVTADGSAAAPCIGQQQHCNQPVVRVAWDYLEGPAAAATSELQSWVTGGAPLLVQQLQQGPAGRVSRGGGAQDSRRWHSKGA